MSPNGFVQAIGKYSNKQQASVISYFHIKHTRIPTHSIMAMRVMHSNAQTNILRSVTEALISEFQGRLLSGIV